MLLSLVYTQGISFCNYIIQGELENMSNEIKVEARMVVPWWLILIQGIASLVLGGYLLMKPGMTTVVLVQFLGWYWLFSGIFSLISLFMNRESWGWTLFSGILGILAGSMVIGSYISGAVIVTATFILIMGIQGIIAGGFGIYAAFKGAGWGAGIMGALSILFGFLIIGNPIVAGMALPFVLGIFAVVGGIAAIIMAFKAK